MGARSDLGRYRVSIVAHGGQLDFGLSAARGFTLIELLVVIAVIAILAAILSPYSPCKEHRQESAVREQPPPARGCRDNVRRRQHRQLRPGGVRYTHRGQPLALARLETGYGRTPFNPKEGPLWSYMGRTAGIKTCPTLRDSLGADPAGNFEAGCGGYGYNQTYVGGTYYKYGYTRRAAKEASRTSDIRRPGKTVMFTDAGICKGDAGMSYVSTYSFCEPPFFLGPDGAAFQNPRPTPTIHFRHTGRAIVAWCDGHVSSERMTFTTDGANAYGGDNREKDMGWFGPQNNSLFDAE